MTGCSLLQTEDWPSTLTMEYSPNSMHRWSWLAQNHAGPIASGAGAKRHEIHLADINGDGKADFLKIHDNGVEKCWLNGGANKRASGRWLWYPQGRIASGIGTSSLASDLPI